MSENNSPNHHLNIHHVKRSPSPYNPRRFDKLAREECWNNV
jgi:hypothetical protein